MGDGWHVETLAERLPERRSAQRPAMSRGDLAHAAQVDPLVIDGAETRARFPCPTELRRIALALGCTTDELLVP